MGRPSDEGMQVEGLAPYADNLHNDLSIAAFDLFPNLLEFKENIESISKLDFFSPVREVLCLRFPKPNQFKKLKALLKLSFLEMTIA